MEGNDTNVLERADKSREARGVVAGQVEGKGGELGGRPKEGGRRRRLPPGGLGMTRNFSGEEDLTEEGSLNPDLRDREKTKLKDPPQQAAP